MRYKYLECWYATDTDRAIRLSHTETAGRFRVWLYKAGDAEPHLIHDRKTEGGFAEMKIIVRVLLSCKIFHTGDGPLKTVLDAQQKQRIREIIDPKRELGHSDKPGKAATAV